MTQASDELGATKLENKTTAMRNVSPIPSRSKHNGWRIELLDAEDDEDDEDDDDAGGGGDGGDAGDS